MYLFVLFFIPKMNFVVYYSVHKIWRQDKSQKNFFFRVKMAISNWTFDYCVYINNTSKRVRKFNQIIFSSIKCTKGVDSIDSNLLYSSLGIKCGIICSIVHRRSFLVIVFFFIIFDVCVTNGQDHKQNNVQRDKSSKKEEFHRLYNK